MFNVLCFDVSMLSILNILQEEASARKEEAAEEVADFLFDNNIPSIPSRCSFSNNADLLEKRNKMLKRISDPKTYDINLLRSISRKPRREMTRSISLQPRPTHAHNAQPEVGKWTNCFHVNVLFSFHFMGLISFPCVYLFL